MMKNREYDETERNWLSNPHPPEGFELINNFIPRFVMDVIISMLRLKLFHVCKKDPS